MGLAIESACAFKNVCGVLHRESVRAQATALLALIHQCEAHLKPTRSFTGIAFVWSGLVWSGLVWSGLVWSDFVRDREPGQG